MALRFLVVEGNTRDAREAHRSTFGLTPSGSYADTVAALEPGAVCDIAYPADEGANLPDPGGLESYDGVFLTGSALHAYEGGPAVMRQVDLARAAYASGTPLFGSCWGIQIGALAAGGRVARNPAGNEVGFARRITATSAGAAHPLLTGRPAAWDAPAVHLDIVSELPGDVTVLASNTLTPIQAAEIRHAGGVMWGVQYHPEFSLREVASIMGRRGATLVEQGFFQDEDDHRRYVAALHALHDAPERRDLAWQLGLDGEVLDTDRRLAEIRNFITHLAKPVRSQRGRA